MYLVAYHLDDATIAKQKQYGVDLEATTGTIRYYSNSGYKVRLASDALLAAELPYAPRNPNTNQIQ
jgi:hypothetical protein